MNIKDLHKLTTGLARVGEQMTRAGRGAVDVARTSPKVKEGLKLARTTAASAPVKELAVMCGRAGVAGAIVDGAMGGVQALNAVRKGKIDGRQAVIHTGAEAGCGFVTSSAGTAGTLAAYMLTGAMGPVTIAAGMGASVGSRYVYRKIVGETMPEERDTSRRHDGFDDIGPEDD